MPTDDFKAHKAFKELKATLAMLLRDMPAGTTADFADVAVAYWDGMRVSGFYLRDRGRLDEEFDFDENAWENWRDELSAWLAAPRFSERDELKARLSGAESRTSSARMATVTWLRAASQR
ncbi:hypothetical protein [Cupriavidus pinatubonensis]|uniref:hypothetical protein n=1 Tax=Cupriavidus pinatubonensis TaxID=248026 RepID=UPI002159EAE5|nr:hypothetical protein [Cupriavidus pinatubonensis]